MNNGSKKIDIKKWEPKQAKIFREVLRKATVLTPEISPQEAGHCIKQTSKQAWNFYHLLEAGQSKYKSGSPHSLEMKVVIVYLVWSILLAV